MYVTHYPMVIHSCDKYGTTMSKDKKAVAQTQSHVFQHEVKCQRGIWIIIVCDTSSHGDRPMYKIW